VNIKKNKLIISANVLFTISNFRKDLIIFFKEKGFDIVCISNTDDLKDISAELVSSLNIKFIKIELNRKGINPIEDFKYIYNLIKIYKKEKADLIMHFTIKPNIYGTLASRIVGIPSINTVNGLGSAIIKENFLSKVLKYLYKFSLIFSEKVFFQNKDDLDFFADNKLVNRNKTGIVPGSGVDVDSFNDCESNNEKLTFLLVARLLKDKGIYEYIGTVKRLKKKYSNCRFLLAGQFDVGNPTAISKNEIKGWENNNIIEFLGKTDNIKEFLKIADVIVLPSYREGLSRVLIESAAASKPIITTNVPGCKEIVTDEKNGYLCDVKSIGSLQKCIETMIHLSKNERIKMGEYSKLIAKTKFDSALVNDIYYNEVKRLCSI